MLKTRWPWLLLATLLLVAFCGWAAVRVRSSDWYVAETKYAQIKERMTIEEVEAVMGHERDGYLHTAYLALATWSVGDYGIWVDLRLEGKTWRVEGKSLQWPDTAWERLRTWFQ